MASRWVRLRNFVTGVAPAALTASGFPGLGSVVGAINSGIGTQRNNDANAQMNQQNNAWTQHQFASRYQTTVQDMQAAGLNPMRIS